MINLLFIGDIVGRGGRKAIELLVPKLLKQYNCSFCIANGENAAHGNGINRKCVIEISKYVDAITLGDHVWDVKSFEEDIKDCNNVIRPANMHFKCPGIGYKIFDLLSDVGRKKIAVVNLLGTVFMKNTLFCPFTKIIELLDDIYKITNCIIVDFHAEATSEKITMGRFLDGKVTAVVGTHTHVQTSDPTILNNKTAYITDVGMVGAINSVIGRKIDDVIYKFSVNMPNRLNVVETGEFRLDAVVISYNIYTGKANSIKSISEIINIK